jgi:hypothetical protein
VSSTSLPGSTVSDSQYGHTAVWSASRRTHSVISVAAKSRKHPKLIFPRRSGHSDYAAKAAVWDLNSNSIGLRYCRWECLRCGL